MEQTPDTFWSLFAGYTAIWGILVVYIFSIGRRISRLEQEREHSPAQNPREQNDGVSG